MRDNLQILFLLIFLAIYLLAIALRAEIGLFFSEVSSDGWMGFLGSSFGIIGAFLIASYHFEKQKKLVIESELESTKRRLNIQRGFFKDFYNDLKMLEELPELYAQNKNEWILEIQTPSEEIFFKLKEELQPLTNYHLFIHLELARLLEVLLNIQSCYSNVRLERALLDREDHYTHLEDLTYHCSEVIENLNDYVDILNTIYLKLEIDEIKFS